MKQLGGDVIMSRLRSRIALPDDDARPGNVVRLGTETLHAIGEELRRMYDADLRSKPSKQLERLVRWIEHGDKPSQSGSLDRSERTVLDK